MKVNCWVAPVKPQDIENLRQLGAALEHDRRAEYVQSERRIGVEREVFFLWERPEGSYCVMFMQGDDLESTIKDFNASNDPFDIWAREQLFRVSNTWPDPIWGSFPTPGVLETISVYDALHEDLDAESAR